MGLGLALSCTGVFSMASDFGTADEARTMLEKAAAALEADEKEALEDFNAGAEGFKDKDLYVFCGGADGMFSAHGTKADALVGKVSLQNLKDKKGNELGKEMYSRAAEGKIVEVAYMWPKPGGEEPVDKLIYATRVGDQICGVGYYK
ncbi:MAG: chemotaxis protein [Candidatus Contendobacter odensis]|uniref:Chemotaxis protein n=1 Tax=Candidatus Contendibacter odensensis TaxID=1400860 RepID=A0A2G6PER7_9GAMM|nr:MAG: chemotaxis protein [Candidatus Contendobacter odensis]